jgi:hypothetical protein
MLNPHAPELRKILWGGLVAWLIQAFVIAAWLLARAPVQHGATHGHEPILFAHHPAAGTLQTTPK